ncbi:hypothetical protein BLNAU_25199 [Blattamonas nauphoetae]|uniref:Uncharacterized protein n=1 Tax=Blattamonas nauphoetae TaxID=2049346 RepID=A0ABQ9WK87_9EUKA|nr:hypothetical protein BLNAU_25199 [Blattamonas nauphoetae]
MRADPFSSSVSSSIYSWILPPTKAKAKVAAANQAKPKTTTAPKTKQKTQGSTPAPSPQRTQSRPNVSVNRSHALGPANQVKQALSVQLMLPPLSSNIKTLQMLLPINEKLKTSMHSVVEETFVAICDLSQGTTDKKIHLVKPPTLPVLLCLLEHPNIDITHASITTLHNMILVGVLRIPDNKSRTVF